MAAREASSRCCPSGPIPAKSIWREYFSWRDSFTKGTVPAGAAEEPAKVHDSQRGQVRQRRCARLRLSERKHEIGLGQWVARDCGARAPDWSRADARTDPARRLNGRRSEERRV